MNIYIIQSENGQCVNVSIEDNGGKLFSNAPDDIMAVGGGYSVSEVVEQEVGIYTGVFKLTNEVLFPFSSDGRNIRVELTDSIVTTIAMNPQTRPLLEWAYHLPSKKTETGIILWFVDFTNDIMSETETEQLLLSFGAVITRK
jgi:hypothetical protein